MSTVLQFGIPSLDALFGRLRQPGEVDDSYNYGAFGIHLSEHNKATSLSIIGPDGTGKSVFGLHLAAQYMADANIAQKYFSGTREQRWQPRVLYVSTDLKYHVAHSMWKNFALEQPNERDFPFYWAYRRGHPNSGRKVKLAKLDPAGIQGVVLDGSAEPKESRVHFVDLVSTTMGDDWAFINRLLAVLRTPPQQCAPHFLIIDAVEGFETLVGERDAFGESTSRRARIAQIMRAAGEKCHVCFIVEEPKDNERFPEEFVTDVVVRLRSVSVNNYARRTVEILKARGQSHVRGQHPFVIRDSKPPSSTEWTTNADEPEVNNSYVHIFPSLHYLSREGMKWPARLNPSPRKDRVAAFGITYLDEMLGRLADDVPVGLDDQGLLPQTAAALVGEIATQKTSLATAFLARTFRAFVFRLADIIRELQEDPDTDLIRNALTNRASFSNVILGTKEKKNLAPQVADAIGCIRARNTSGLRNLFSGIESATGISLDGKAGYVGFAAWLAEALDDNGAAVLITTSDQDRDRLVSELDRWLENSRLKALQNWPSLKYPLGDEYSEPFSEAVRAHLRNRTICRRLELHDLSSATFFQIIQRSVERAQEKVFLSDDLQRNVDRLPYHRDERFKRSWNIRVVVDDLSTLKDAYPEISSDPIFLPFLLSFLEGEGVTSLIVDSQMGRPDAVVTDALDRELRALVVHKILTWRVPFFGGMRDVITVVPPYPTGLPSTVREVRWQAKEAGVNALVVDPEMELYTGFDKDVPTPVPLEVRLYAETGPTAEYIREQNEIFGRLFTPVGTQHPEKAVIVGVDPGSTQYDSLRDFCNLQAHTLLNHTMVFQVDEFWATSRSSKRATPLFPRGPVSPRGGTLHPLGRYLTEITSASTRSGKLVVDRVADPFGVFQGRPLSDRAPQKGPWQRRHYFARSFQWLPGELKPSEVAKLDRVPYTWDFGFLLCPRSMWEFARNRKIGYKEGTKEHTVESVWKEMPSVVAREHQPYVPWRMFLGACKAVAQAQAERTSAPIRVIDVSTLAEESFSCLLLEVWASEILDSLSSEKQIEFAGAFSHIDWNSPGRVSLIDWLENPEYVLAFYKTWLLLTDVIAFSEVVDPQAIPRLKAREADVAAVATRHWYKTACRHQQCEVSKELMLPVRLPGHFSVRGDWFLAVAGGSRSERLACRALDLFSTRRANFRRMELGLGLPTRDIAIDEVFDKLPTALVKCDERGQTMAVTYGELIGTNIPKRDHFSWFWRSQLRDYHRHSRLLHRWVGQTMWNWEELRKKIGPVWQSGFEVYDRLEGRSSKDAAEILGVLQSWSDFEQMCKLLIAQLRTASRSTPREWEEEVERNRQVIEMGKSLPPRRVG